MTEVIGNVVIIEPEEDKVCEFCGNVAECRPYGEGGKLICFKCAMKPENIDTVKRNARKLLFGTEGSE